MNDQHEWHVAINKFSMKDPHNHPSFMYRAKDMFLEIPRIAKWFAMERKDELPLAHQQCSQSEEQPISGNYLTCALGVRCKECPYLLALEQAEATSEQIDEFKAWTCAAHIISEGAKRLINDSEGYIQDVGDKLFWANVYSSLSSGDPNEELIEAGEL